ncbi:MAG: Gfo/Idh/MocA family oxidoreductase [Xanthomonadales bacterium]
MNRPNDRRDGPDPADPQRRKLIGAAGAGVFAATLGGMLGGGVAWAADRAPLRWGVVGTGGIANSMAPRITEAAGAVLAAVSSRRMETAQEFAGKHDVPNAFDSWQDMIASDTIDAVYIATPTSVREEIGVAAANHGKHVLGEKPFASLPSLRRIVAACRENGVGFMDGTHFPHLARTRRIQSEMAALVGRPWSVASAFQFDLTDTSNIRLRPDLEPYGAIGDAGWYNMRAAVEFLPDDVKLVASDAWLQREPVNNAVVSGSGVMRFNDGSASTWNCAFISGTWVQDLRITGPDGVLWIDDFVGARGDERYRVRRGRDTEEIAIPFSKHQATSMFEDFTKMVHDPAMFEASVRASERTQAWLDAAWESAIANEERVVKPVLVG